MTKVSTTLAKNSDERLSLSSNDKRCSGLRAVYAGAIGWEYKAFVCSSKFCAR